MAVFVIGGHKSMGRNTSLGAAAVTLAWCCMCVVSRVLMESPSRSARDKHSSPINTLSEVPLKENEMDTSDYIDIQFMTSADIRSKADHIIQMERNEDPEVSPGLFQGDMMDFPSDDFYPMNTRVALNWEKFPERRWPNATVPYVISDLYDTSQRKMILMAIHTLDFLTCIKFVPWDEVAADYLLIWPMKNPKGCWSYVGRRGGQQVVSLQPPNFYSKNCFISVGKPIHELLHALGMFHEQSRPDRDKYIDIITDNIIPRFLPNFKKQSAQNTTFTYTYDYDSVMHYGFNFFSVNMYSPTIVPKVKGAHIGQRIMLSKNDCLKLNDLYGCLDDPFDREKYINFCTFLGY